MNVNTYMLKHAQKALKTLKRERPRGIPVTLQEYIATLDGSWKTSERRWLNSEIRDTKHDLRLYQKEGDREGVREMTGRLKELERELKELD